MNYVAPPGRSNGADEMQYRQAQVEFIKLHQTFIHKIGGGLEMTFEYRLEHGSHSMNFVGLTRGYEILIAIQADIVEVRVYDENIEGKEGLITERNVAIVRKKIHQYADMVTNYILQTINQQDKVKKARAEKPANAEEEKKKLNNFDPKRPKKLKKETQPSAVGASLETQNLAGSTPPAQTPPATPPASTSTTDIPSI